MLTLVLQNRREFSCPPEGTITHRGTPNTTQEPRQKSEGTAEEWEPCSVVWRKEPERFCQLTLACAWYGAFVLMKASWTKGRAGYSSVMLKVRGPRRARQGGDSKSSRAVLRRSHLLYTIEGGHSPSQQHHRTKAEMGYKSVLKSRDS